MAEENGNRVEPRQVMVGRGMGATPEKINELEQRQAQLERAYRAEPEKSFLEVFSGMQASKKEQPDDEAEQESKEETKPKPMSLAATYRKQEMGIDEKSSEPVIIKG